MVMASPFKFSTGLAFLFFVTFFLILTDGKEPTYLAHVCSNRTTFTTDSPYQANLNTVLSALATRASSDSGFGNVTAGQRPDSVYGFFLCRGDVRGEGCKDCVVFAANNSLKLCPVVKQAVLYYEQCLLRYTNRALFSIMDTSDGVYLWGSQDVLDNQGRYDELVGTVMRAAVREAATSARKLATNKANYTKSQTIYSLVQCTPDLSSVECNRCLMEIINQLPTGKQSARVLTPSCTARHDFFAFYNESLIATPAAAPAVLPPQARPEGKSHSKITIVAITAPIAVCAILFIFAYWLLVRRWRQEYNALEENAKSDIMVTEALQLNFAAIEAATDKFSENNKLGAGGFGEVYKGVLPNGQEIAVKRLSKRSCQGAEEFKNEVLLVAKLQHRNLVRFLGFCLEGGEKILVYEFVPNRSLDNFLFDSEKREQLDWSRRYNLIIGIARAILYLHEESQLKVIHRDLKASNILLDGKMNPKISDFGIARIFGADQTQANTKRIIGTYGYMPPEYAMHGRFSMKSDIYSFGVLILEIISGKNNTNFYQTDGSEDLPSYAWKLWRKGTPLEFLDSMLGDSYSRNEVVRCIHIGLLCLQEDPGDRPSIATIVLVLNSYSVSLPNPKQPAFVLRSKGDSTMPIKTLDSSESTGPYPFLLSSNGWSVNEVSITEIDPR
ncbi:cysteine-rich receptor-like protein kinase 10 [Carica papaya]|uniref:cysteine-rich receptor-like protein kinase 10 n=1 Tax=Carica papaya TaxID=3649 RepID=UPI000B8CE77D|nr:cysteine-rich receptor-like protein kinase 10 [Carica papaya]